MAQPLPQNSPAATPWLDIRTFVWEGDDVAVDDPGSDWAPIFTRAITAIHAIPVLGADQNPPSDLQTYFSATLYLPRGTYYLSRPIIIARYLPGDRLFQRCSLSIVGEAAGGSDTPAVCLYRALRNTTEFPFPPTPAIIIQGARIVHLRNLLIRGDNRWSNTLTQDAVLQRHFDPAATGQYNVAGPDADRPGAPYAGVCIDPFLPNIPDDRRYPDLGDYYRPRRADPDVLAAPEPSSSRILLANCEISGFNVGVCVAPSGLGEQPAFSQEPTLTLQNTRIRETRIAVSLGGQRRVLVAGSVIDRAEDAFNGIAHGRPGAFPAIAGLTVSLVKNVFLVDTTTTTAAVNDLHALNIVSLGRVGSEAATAPLTPDTLQWLGCRFLFANPQLLATVAPSADTHLVNLAVARFLSCSFAFARRDANALDPPLHIVNRGFLTFERSVLGGVRSTRPDEQGPLFYVSGDPAALWLQDCLTMDRPRADLTRRRASLTQLGAALREELDLRLLWPFALQTLRRPFLPGRAPPAGAPSAVAVCNRSSEIPLGSPSLAAFTVVGPDQVSFQATAGMLQVGDVLVTPAAFSATFPTGNDVPLVLGRVLDVTPLFLGPTAIVTLTQVPRSLFLAIQQMAPRTIANTLVVQRRVHPTIRATRSTGSPLLTNVQSPVPLDQTFAPSHRVQGEGLMDGAFVLIVDQAQQQLTLSLPAQSDGTARIYDADVRALSTTAL